MISMWSKLDEEEKHDLKILKEVRYMQIGKMGADPSIRRTEKKRKRRKDSSDTILYADLGARESAMIMMEFEEKSGVVIVKLYKV